MFRQDVWDILARGGNELRKFLGYLAPGSPRAVMWKTLLFCVLIVLWNYLWVRHLSGHPPRSMAAIVTDALVVGGPFALLFSLASWDQVRTIRGLHIRARIDPLAGVLNRQTFIGRFQKAVAQARCGMLLLIDADDFKRINDFHGHAVGDRCIAAIGNRLSWHLREEDLAGRIGGEEFAVFLPEVSREHGNVVARRLGQPVAFSDAAGEMHHSVTLSIGAVWTQPDQSPEDLLMLADEALYEAKSTGRARMIVIGEVEPVLLGSPRPDQPPARRGRSRQPPTHRPAA
ncbi:MAG: GGDEF domain-containing protein [Silicimonas sp.]|nr:GGDEF domain-containing protein [Silicimonas sp.]